MKYSVILNVGMNSFLVFRVLDPFHELEFMLFRYHYVHRWVSISGSSILSRVFIRTWIDSRNLPLVIESAKKYALLGKLI